METARLWMLRVNEPDFEGWEAFTQWLECEPGHARAYNAMLDLDHWAGALVNAGTRVSIGAAGTPPGAASWEGAEVTRLTPTPPHHSHARKRPDKRSGRMIAGGALAASVAAVVSLITFGGMPFGAPEMTEIVTRPGEHRSITLPDGSRVTLNGNSRALYDPEAPRIITLARGEALFDVHHDDATPFVVEVGKTRLVDAGTVFNVVHDNAALEVAVAEGAVFYRDHGDEVRLDPGDRLMRARPGGTVELSHADPDTIGTWREGVLQYDNAPLPLIARDLSRIFGKPVHIAREARDMRYTGTLVVHGSDLGEPNREMTAGIAALLGVEFTEQEDSWEMTPADEAPR